MAESPMATAEVGPMAADDGVRMTWNVWPHTKVEASKCVVPVAASFSPIRAAVPPEDIPSVPYLPLRCKTCASVLNPFSNYDLHAKIWICPFCYGRNHFPPHYASAISPTNLPAELFPQYLSIEYSLGPHLASSAAAAAPPVFLFILDTCLIEEELGFLKSALRQALGLLPENALVGLISYGTQVQVHELGFSDLPKVYVFRGTKELSKEQILDQLGLSPANANRAGKLPPMAAAPGGAAGTDVVTRFLLPASDCEYTLNSVSIFTAGLMFLFFPSLPPSLPPRCCCYVFFFLLRFLHSPI